MNDHANFIREGDKLRDMKKKMEDAYSAYCLILEEVRVQDRKVNELFKRLAESTGGGRD